MKKERIRQKIKIAVSICFTVCAVLAGAALPPLFAGYEKQKTFDSVTVRESEKIVFVPASHVLDSIRLVSSAFETVPLKKTDRCAQTDIEALCLDIAGIFAEYGFLPGDVNALRDFEASPSLAVHSQGTQYSRIASIMEAYGFIADDIEDDAKEEIGTSILWECSFSDSCGDRIELLVDDASGKAVGFCITLSEGPDGESPDEITDRAANAVDDHPGFFMNYYGLAGADRILEVPYNGLKYEEVSPVREKTSAAAGFSFAKSNSQSTVFTVEGSRLFVLRLTDRTGNQAYSWFSTDDTSICFNMEKTASD